LNQNGNSGPAITDLGGSFAIITAVNSPMSVSAFAGNYPSNDPVHMAIPTKELLAEDIPDVLKNTMAY